MQQAPNQCNGSPRMPLKRTVPWIRDGMWVRTHIIHLISYGTTSGLWVSDQQRWVTRDISLGSFSIGRALFTILMSHCDMFCVLAIVNLCHALRCLFGPSVCHSLIYTHIRTTAPAPAPAPTLFYIWKIKFFSTVIFPTGSKRQTYTTHAEHLSICRHQRCYLQWRLNLEHSMWKSVWQTLVRQRSQILQSGSRNQREVPLFGDKSFEKSISRRCSIFIEKYQNVGKSWIRRNVSLPLIRDSELVEERYWVVNPNLYS